MISARDIPNLITFLRIILVAPVTWLLLEARFGAALALFAVAGVSDGLDGWLAKHYGWQSRLGSLLDPVADKLLLVCAYLALGWTGLLPIWLVALVLGRDLVIVTGAAAFHFLVGPFEARPMITSKINTFAQILLVIAVILAQLTPLLEPPVVGGLIAAVAITTVVSGVGYVWSWGARARRHWGAHRRI